MKKEVAKQLKLPAALLIGVAVLFSSSLAMAQAGQLDSTFATRGIFTSGFLGFDNALALQSDGKIVVAGNFFTQGGDDQGGTLVRLNTNGTLDTSFGSGGVVISGFGLFGGLVVSSISIQPDGKILAAARGFNPAFVVGRFSPDGSVDTTFGTAGVSRTLPFNQPVLVNVLALQPDGKILLAGGGFLERLNNSGQVDTTFGINGAAPVISVSPTAIALQGDGKILLTTGLFPRGQAGMVSQAGSISRYTADGALDTSFGVQGQAASVAQASAIALQGDGKIVVAGALTSNLFPPPAGNDTGFGLVRYNSNGSIDTTFGKHGGVITDFGSSAPFAVDFALAIQSNGNIIAAGQAGPRPVDFTFVPSSLALARYTSDGRLDLTFGMGGKVITNLGSNNLAFISATALQSDGNIVVAASSGVPSRLGYIPNYVVARYLGH